MRKLLTTVTSLGLLFFVRPVFAGPVTNLAGVRLVKRSVSAPIPKEVEYVFDRDLGAGRTRRISDGADGELCKTVYEVRVGNKTVGRQETVKTIVEAKPIVIAMGRTGFSTSRGSFTRAKLMDVVATAYTPRDGSGTGRTATGRRANFGVVAVDPKIIPLNSLVYVEGYGFAVAADTGGAIKGNRIDVCFQTRREVSAWGRRKVTIHVFKEKVGRGE